MTANFRFVQAQPFTLAGAGASVGDSTLILSSFKQIDGTTDITMTNFGAIGFGTIEPGSSTREEQISFTGVTQNTNGTATLTGVKSVGFVYPYTATSNIQKSHAGGVSFVISNTAGFYDQLTANDDDETVTGLWTFTQFPQKSGSTTPTAAAELASKAYVDSVAGGSAVYDQNVISGIAGETLAAGKLVYFKVSDGRWWKTDGTSAATVNGVKLGFAQGTATAGNAVNVVIGGIDKNQTGLTAGTIYYASDTAGSISSSAGTVSRAVGQALTTTSIILDGYFTLIPTAKEKAAIVGDNGTPSSANTFVTQTGFQRGQEIYAATATGNDSYAVTLSPAPTAYVTGMVVNFKTDVANTGTASLNVNGLGAVTIKKNGSATLADNDIAAGQVVTVIYDGTNFQMQSQTGNTSFLDYQAFTSSGTWTKPTGLSGNEVVLVHLWGGGGAGGGVNATTTGGGGGGGGAFIARTMLASSLSSTVTVTIGAGGTGSSGANGGAGGNSTFGSYLTAYGGGGGARGSGGTIGGGGGGGGDFSAGSTASGATGGAGGDFGGGAAATKPSNGQGGAGGASDTTTAPSSHFGGAGGGGSTAGAGASGAGGSSVFGGGGGGAGGTQGVSTGGAGGTSTFGGNGGAGAANGTGTAGSQPGGGGGGGGSANPGTATGGAGGAGQCRVWVLK